MFPKILTPVLFPALLGACYTWHSVPTSPAPSTGLLDSVIHVTLADGRSLELAQPSIAQDTLRAWDRRDLARGSPRPVVVPVSEIWELDLFRVTLIDGRRFKLALPNIAHDTLRAWDPREFSKGRAIPVTVPLSEIRAIQARRFSAGKTSALGVHAGLAVGFVAVLAIVLSNFCLYSCE